MMRAIWKSITFKWMAFSIFLATIPLAIAGGNIYKVYQKDIKESIIQIEKEKASMVAERTKGFLEKTTSNLLLIASDEGFKKTNPSQAKGDLKNFLSQNDHLFELAFLNEKGLEMVKVSKFKPEGGSDQKDQSMTQMFQVASKGQIFYGNFYYTSDGRMAMVIAVPVGKYMGRPVSVLRARAWLEPLMDSVHQIKIGRTGFAYLIDKQGHLVAHPGDKNIFIGPFVDKIIAGQEGGLEFENLKGEKYLAVYKPIPELKWGVVVQVPTEEAYAPLKEVASVAIKWILISLCVAFLIGLFFTRRLVRPIKQLSSQMARVSSGDLDVYIETHKKDEVGMLTGSFNQMIRDLKESQGAIKKAEEKYRAIFENSKDMVYITSVDGKFIDVNQAGVEMFGYESKEELMKTRVRDSYFNPEERKRFQNEIAQEGFTKDFEVQLKKKDGTPIDVLITGSVRRNESGEIIGYEGIIKNISERKRMEEELLQSKKELQALYDLAVLINQSLDMDQVLTSALEKGLDITGFEKGTLHLLNEHEKTLELKYHRGFSPALVESVNVLKSGEGVAGKAVSSRKPVLVSIDEYPSLRIYPHLKEEKIRLTVGIPLLTKEKAIGAITLSSRSFRILTQREIHLLESIGDQIGMAIENAELFSAVEKARSEWETTFNSVTDSITIKDKNYRILRANRTVFERYGMKPEEMIGRKCYEVFYNRETPCEGCKVTETLKTKKLSFGERESKLLKGIFEYFTFPVLDGTGEVIAVIDTSREITEQKRLEMEKEVVNNINKILASSLDVRDVIRAVKTELKRIISADRMTLTLLDEKGEGFRYFALEKDYEAQELIVGVTYPKEGTPLTKVTETGQPVIVSDTEKSDSWVDQKLLKEGIRSSLVFPLEYKGKVIGTINFGSKEANYYSDYHVKFLHSIAYDLAISIQNSLLLEEIRGSEERYRAVVEGAMDGVLIVGDDYRFRFVNEKLAEILGYTGAELLGMDFREALDEESKALVADRYVRRQRGEDVPSQYEFNVIRKDGEVRNVEISSSIVKDSKGNITTVAFIKEVTEKKKMEEQLLQTEKLRALGEMASGVAHDFNNALAAILGNTQLLLHTAQDEETREALKTIEKVTKDSAQTVKRLQDFTRKRARQELFKLDVNSIVKDAIEITKPKWRNDAQGKGIHIEVLSSLGEVPGVAGDASELREVITNLIFNAVEAMPQGGTIEFHTFKKGGDVHIRIADTGIGMDEENRKRIFEPFFTTKPFSNTGLGLSMSYGIIRRFNGEIRVESKVGSGTAFNIVLPVAIGGREAVVSHDTIKPVKPARILVIDDEDTVREVVAKMLSQVNHQVTVAKSGEEGVRLFGEKKFDIVLTDLGMPGMSGWEVCKSIKKIKSSTPVGRITGWGLEVDESKKEESGLDFIITKPFDFNEIIRLVSEKVEFSA